MSNTVKPKPGKSKTIITCLVTAVVLCCGLFVSGCTSSEAAGLLKDVGKVAISVTKQVKTADPATCEHFSTKTEIVSEPSCTAEGLQKVVCEQCGTTLSETPIEKTAHNFVEGKCSECGASDTSGDGGGSGGGGDSHELPVIDI